MKRIILIILTAFLALSLTSCGGKPVAKGDEHGHAEEKGHAEEEGGGHDDHGEKGGKEGASFKEGKGITLLDETKKSIGLELIEVAEQDLKPTLLISAQVYRAAGEISRAGVGEQSGQAYATAFIPPEAAQKLVPGQELSLHMKTGAIVLPGKLWRVDEAQVPVTGKAEAIIAIEDPSASLPVGIFLSGKLALTGGGKTIAIPHSAVLETAVGTYAFVQNGEHLLRTEVKTGSRNDDFTEITEGLYEGDTVAIQPVETLYIVELRATKGGGHSH